MKGEAILLCGLVALLILIEAESMVRPGTGSIQLLLVAGEEGSLGNVSVAVFPGNGIYHLNLETFADMEAQESLSNAMKAVSKITGKVFDASISLNSPSGMVSGPSIGAPAAVAVASAITGKKIRPGMAITGNIDSDGNIEPVAGLEEKIKLAKNVGYITVLVPSRGDGEWHKRVEECDISACKVYYALDYSRLSEEYGVSVIAVTTLDEALDHMLEGWDEME